MNTQQMSEAIASKLDALSLPGRIVDVRRGPVVSTFLYRPEAHVRVAQLNRVVDDLSLALAGRVRVLGPMEGEGEPVVGFEVPNANRVTVGLSQLCASPKFLSHPSPLAWPIGVDTYGNEIITDLRTMPHLLVAGTTGSGKSTALHDLIISLMARTLTYPAESQRAWFSHPWLMLIDAKGAEFSRYDCLRNKLLLRPVLVDGPDVIEGLSVVVAEVEFRYAEMARHGARTAAETGQPDIVVVIDELADLMLGYRKELELLITRIAQKARAAGVYMALATQRPSVDVLTGVIKGNLPSRLCFRVPTRVDSRVVLDRDGAETLLGNGDGLLSAPGFPLSRLQAPLAEPQFMQGVIAGCAARPFSIAHLNQPKRSFWQRLRGE
jgi:DNA segregation ATPase FtsK/SpoIIIE, S-DNA-T family